MYGYLKPYTVSASAEVRRRYKQYYCSLCHALWKNYGQLSRLIVSYDITFIAVVLNRYFTLPDGKISCLKKCHNPETEDNWKKLAALSIMMVASKIEDDIMDEKSKKAHIGKAILGGTIAKVKSDFPQAYATMLQAMDAFNTKEGMGSDIDILANSFSDVIIKTLQALFPEIDNTDIIILRHVTQWVYFIDAVDDFSQDLKEKKMNPFLGMGNSKHELINYNHDYIQAFIEKQTCKLLSATQANYDATNLERRVIANIIDGTIPEVTYKVFSDSPNYPRDGILKTTIKKGVMYG